MGRIESTGRGRKDTEKHLGSNSAKEVFRSS